MKVRAHFQTWNLSQEGPTFEHEVRKEVRKRQTTFSPTFSPGFFIQSVTSVAAIKFEYVDAEEHHHLIPSALKQLLSWTTKFDRQTLHFPSLKLKLHFYPFSQSSFGSSGNAQGRHSPECVKGLLHHLDVKRVRIILFGYERVISRVSNSAEKFSHKLEAHKCRCPRRQELMFRLEN